MNVKKDYRLRLFEHRDWQTHETSGSIALFMFNDQDGLVVVETVGGNDADVDVPSLVGWVPGPFNGAYDIAAAAEVVANHATAFDIGTAQDFTLDIVTRINSAATNYLIRHANDYYVRFTSGGILEVAERNHGGVGHGATSLSSVNLSDLDLYGRWFHLKIQYDHSGPTITAWVNGDLIQTVTPVGTATVAAISDDLELGKQASSTHLDGALAYVRISTALENDFMLLAHTYQGHTIGKPPRVSGQVVRPLDGVVESTAWEIELVDHDSAVAGRLADDTHDRLTWHGAIAELAMSKDGGNFQVIAAGRVSHIDEPSRGRFLVQVEDERVVERETKVFEKTSTVCFAPTGPIYDYAGPRVSTTRATVTRIVTSGGRDYVQLNIAAKINNTTVLRRIVNDVKDIPWPGHGSGVNWDVGNFVHTRIYVDGAEREIVTFDSAFIYNITEVTQVLFYPAKTFVEILNVLLSDESINRIIHVWVPVGQSDSGDNTWPTSPPSVGDVFDDCQIYPVDMPLDDEFPLHIGVADDTHEYGTTNGGIHPFELTRRLYRAAGVQYSVEVFDALIANPSYGTVKYRITEAPTNLAQWLEDNVYKPYLVAPFVDQHGRVAPRSVALPNGDDYDPDSLFEFNEHNIMGGSPTWYSAGREMRNIVEASYLMEQPPQAGTLAWLAQLNGGPQVGPVDYLQVKEIPHVVKFQNLQSTGRRVQKLLVAGLHEPDTAKPLIERYAQDLFSFYGDGPQEGRIDGLDECDVVRAGDWVKVSEPTQVNVAEDSGRGGSRLALVLSKTLDPAGPEFQILDGGPNVQPLSTPTISSVVNHALVPEHIQTISYTGMPTGWAVYGVLEYAVNATEPAATSPLWTLSKVIFTSTSSGSTEAHQLPSGSVIWWRLRAYRSGRVASSWSTAVSQTTASLSPPSNVSFTDVEAEQFTVHWDNGEAYYPIEMEIASRRIGVFKEGTRSTVVRNLPPNTNLTVYVRHIDKYGGYSSWASNSQTTAITTLKWPMPGRILVLPPGEYGEIAR